MRTIQRLPTVLLLLLLLVVVVMILTNGCDGRIAAADDDTCTSGSSSSSSTECAFDYHNHTPEEEPEHVVQDFPECHLYMGRSTIPNAGLGIFSGRPYHYHNDEEEDDDPDHGNKNSYIGLGDICIPMIDMYTHINLYHPPPPRHRSTNPSDATTTNTSTTPPLFSNPMEYDAQRHWVHNPLRDYFWNGYAVMGMVHGETSSVDVEAYCPGLDCAINCHLGLVNVASSIPIYNDYHSTTTTTTTMANSHNNQDAPPHRHVHPGTGAYSPYHIRPPSAKTASSSSSSSSSSSATKQTKKANVIRNIPIGGELFKHYGESWFTTRPEVFGNIPLTHDYVLGEEIVQRFLALTQSKDNAVWVEDLYNQVLIQTIQRIYDTRTLNALPRQYTEIQDVLRVTDDDDDGNDDDGIITRVLQKKHQRSIRELQQTGACLDHIRPDTSTIPYAGDGAFATRSLPSSTILTISPLHHIPNYYNFMNMYKIQRNNQRTKSSPHGGKVPPDDDEDDDAPYYRILDEIQNQQVLMNYCYGHANSTVLLCPYGSGINYLNHHSTLYNVKLQWIPSTSTELIHTFQHNSSAVEHGTVDDLFRTERSQLAIMYVTIRDIQEGEELFIDYGPEWERAWNLHVQQFFDTNRNDRPPSYVSAFYFNTMFGQIPLPTIQEQEQQQLPGLHMIADDRRPCHLPDNLQVRCHRALLFQAIGNINYEYVWTDENHGVPCRIVDRFDALFDPTNVSDSGNGTELAKQFLYTIQLEWEDASGGGEEAESSSHISWMLRTDVPRSAIQLFDVPFTSDIHQRRTFRHPIYLSNDLFPEQWRNLE